MNSFALYRLPFADQYVELTQHYGEPDEYSSIEQLNGKHGFVLAPFSVGSENPVLLIRPDEIVERGVDELEPLCRSYVRPVLMGEHSHRGGYAEDFDACMEKLHDGEFKKIVLARSTRMIVSNPYKARALFARACKQYPRMLIALVYTPRSGTWLVATPEILVENNGEQWRTIALAGTMAYEEIADNPEAARYPLLRWSTKNIREQQFVASYVADTLSHIVGDFTEDGPFSVRAGNLVHLRSDFTFTHFDRERIGDLLAALHPTPAVCGLPKEATRQFIANHESLDRKYYSGFMGPLNLDSQSHIYISLRCAHVEDSGYTLYAGGGLIRESVEDSEWAETEEKMKTMRNVLL